MAIQDCPSLEIFIEILLDFELAMKRGLARSKYICIYICTYERRDAVVTALRCYHAGRSSPHSYNACHGVAWWPTQ